ncbi:Starch-binding associating with outer membrane [Chitinophaga sp. YR573]|uniref:RagB/SusD family nutrient uptake outer membrane protein n=1 Tax=Chitinophaga sp. YR573 TaxID=1881040 RepID=UPI0008BD3511|nr:RagB/SusD family nutrient uptake outer membrane protein [Chitinophaga sp. YR573]SEW17340.1 Starch-binding associating with outer membrane [Chitinophaga sp. YR573]
MNRNTKYAVIIMILSSLLMSCEKYLENTQLPSGTIAGTDAFVSDNSTSAIVTGSFISLNNSGPFTGSSSANIAYITGLYTDELKNISTATFADAFYKNTITSSRVGHWSDLYGKMYVINSTIEGIQNTTATLYYKDQWLGECYFIRALLYYYLVNLYGDVPLALSSDYRVNNTLSRAPQSQVYQQMITDLKRAQTLLSADYKDGFGATTNNRVRPNQVVATALLSKVYMYTAQWDSAEAQATAVINNSAYQLISPDQVFLANSKETIWALATVSDTKVVEYGFYNNGMPAEITPPADLVDAYIVLVAMNSPLLNAFEPNDTRYTNWVRSTTVKATATTPAVTYYFPNKYKSATNGVEKEIVLRLADLYLTRAEARARQNNISGAQSDLDAIRTRAGLPGTTASTQDELLTAISRERQVELFTECGNRYFDLKRSGKIDDVMNVVAPLKGTSWSHYMQLWPIPPGDIVLNPNITPNPGY